MNRKKIFFYFILLTRFLSLSAESSMAQIKQGDEYIVASSRSIGTTQNISSATSFSIINVTPPNLIGATHYLIRIPNSENYLNVENDKTLKIGTYNGKKSTWIHVAYYMGENEFQNHNILLRYTFSEKTKNSRRK